MPSRIVTTLALCFAGAMVLLAQSRRPSAWEALVRANPEIVEDQSLGWKDRLVMNVLTPDQARNYFEGRVKARDLVLEDGRTLADYLELKLSPPAQVFIPLAAPCPLSIVSSSTQGPEVSLVRIKSGKLGLQGGERSGCSIPASATAAMLQVSVRAESGGGEGVKLWATDMPEPAAGGPGSTPLWPAAYQTTLLAPLCEGECPDGDALIRTGGAELTAQVLGYFRALVAGDGPGGGVRLLTEGNNNNFFGTGAGDMNTTGDSNSFFGASAGASNTTGSFNSYFGWNTGALSTAGLSNSFFGASAGHNNTGNANSFFGRDAGMSNTSGSDNVYFGRSSGIVSTTASNNTFVGSNAGFANTSGGNNTFLGRSAGFNNTTGTGSAFFGRSSGLSNTTEDNNTYFGGFSNGVAGITNATAMGYRSQVSQSNSLVLGSVNGLNGATADVSVGIGTDAPQAPLHLLRSDGTARLRVQETSSTTASRTLFEVLNNGGAFFSLRNTNAATTWSFSVSAVGAFQIDNPAVGAGAEMVFFNTGSVRMGPGGAQRFLLDPSGNLTITGDLTANGVLYPSDRELKENVTPVDSEALLKSLAELPIGFWNYKEDPSATRHVGPMAQDFLAKFSVGSDDRHINAMDAAGVTLAGLQGLYKLVREQGEELERLRERNRLQDAAIASLLERIARLEKP